MQIKFELFSDPVLTLAVQPTRSATLKFVTVSFLNQIKLWSYSPSTDTSPARIIALAEFGLHEKQVGNVIWSPDGKYLLTTCDFAVLWEIVEPRYNNKYQKYSSELLEIYSAAWSPDSTRFILGYQNDILSLHNITDGSSVKQKIEYSARALVWDPLDRYIAMLCFDNNVYIRKLSELGSVYKKVSLNVKCKKFSDHLTKRRERKISWSPDCSYIVCPSYEDFKEIPIACMLLRKSDFEVGYVLAGPTSSISCVAFQEQMYKNESNRSVYSIFAMGDSDGNISIWRTGNKGKPLKYLKGGSDDISIESLNWSKDGTLLFASTTKRFMIVVKFKQGFFGTALTDEERDVILNKHYGTSQGGTTSTESQQSVMHIEKIDLTKISSSAELLEERSSPINSQPKSILRVEKSMDGRRVYIPTIRPAQPSSSSIISGSKSQASMDIEMGNKPSGIDRQSVADKGSQREFDGFVSKPSRLDNYGFSQKKPEAESQIIKEKPYSADKQILSNKSNITEGIKAGNPASLPSQLNRAQEEAKRAPTIRQEEPKLKRVDFPSLAKVSQDSMHSKVMFERPSPFEKDTQIKLINYTLGIELKENDFEENGELITMISCTGNLTENISKKSIWTDFVEGKLLICEANSKIVCYYTDKHCLYLTALSDGRRYELPLLFLNIVMIKLNERNDIMLLKNDGHLKVFNIDTQTNLLDENISDIIRELAPPEQPIIENIHLGEDGAPYFFVNSDLGLFYNTTLKAWQKLNQQLLSLDIFKNKTNEGNQDAMDGTEVSFIENFHEFIGLDTSKPGELSLEKKTGVISKLQEALLYCIARDDAAAYVKTAEVYLVKLAQFEEYNKIRQYVLKDLWGKESSKDRVFLKKHNVNIKELIKRFKEMMVSLAIAGNRNLQSIIKEFQELAGSLDQSI